MAATLERRSGAGESAPASVRRQLQEAENRLDG